MGVELKAAAVKTFATCAESNRHKFCGTAHNVTTNGNFLLEGCSMEISPAKKFPLVVECSMEIIQKQCVHILIL